MSRYHTEFDRLYAAPNGTSEALGPGADALLGPDGQTRAMVLDIGRPVEWPLVAALWRAVQEELDLPAPAIAISGEQSFQLWWSLAQAVPAQDAERFLQALQRRFLPAVKPARVRTFPTRADAQAPWTHARRVPEPVMPDQWSAFVAPGLAPVFEETPWVDFPPNEEGQAELLSGIRSVSPAQWKDAWERLAIEADAVGDRASKSPAQAITQEAAPRGEDAPAVALVTQSFNDPRHFLLHVMNDSAVPLALRIDAAKALLPYTVDR